MLPVALATAQPSDISGDRLSGFVLPVEPITSDITISALRAWSWTVEDTHRLLVEGEVRVMVGGYEFAGPAALLWINRIQSARGPINQIAAYFENLEDPAQASGLGSSGEHLLITGSARGTVKLNVSLLRRHPPPPSELMTTARRRLAGYLRSLDTSPLPPLAERPQVDRPSVPPVPIPTPGGPLIPPELGGGTGLDEIPDEPPESPLFAPQGTLWFSWQDARLETGEDENVIIADGRVVVHYLAERDDLWSQLTLSADRVVVFTDPGEIRDLVAGRLDAESIRGIYLEGNVVATSGDNEYAVRAPRVYYDLQSNRAIMLEAVLRTYDRTLGVAIYARAEEMRQIAADQWTARRARVSTSDFYTPHLALGARQITVTQRPGPGDPDTPEVYVAGTHNTLEAGGVPFFYWPHYAGKVDTPPLKSVQGGYRDTLGAVIRTTWDPFSLLGVDRPEGLEADVNVDGYTERGPGLGLDLTYDTGEILGNLDLYGLHDDGVDRTSSGLDVVPPDSWRGIALWEHDMPLGEDWTIQAQASAISDATFVTAWRQLDFYNRREYETTGYVLYQEGNHAFDALVKYNLQDFISNSYLLASRGYQVQKLPEFSYRRYGDSFFDLLTYSGETRGSYMRLDFESGTPNSIGVPAAALPPGLGIGPNTPIAPAFIAAGFPSEWVVRFDTRHELALPLHWGAFNVMPYVVGRFTAYDNDFQSFSTQADNVRLFGSAGVRMTGQFQHVDNRAQSELFGIHRIRHILEPRATVWYGYSNVPDGAYPVYDQSVESIGEGGVAEVGLRSVWQTKRGGPGRWRSVDFLTLDASAVFNTSDVVVEHPTPRFFDYRPENSNFGQHVFATGTWLLSDTLSLVGEGTYDIDNSVIARGSIGTELRHSPVLTTFIEYRYINAGSNQLLEIGWDYQMTRKYGLEIRPQWDFTANDFRAVSLSVTRTFPDFDFVFLVRFDQISNQTTVGATVDLVEF